MKVKPYYLFGDRCRDTLQRELAPVIGRWAKEWLGADMALEQSRIRTYPDCKDECPMDFRKRGIGDVWCAVQDDGHSRHLLAQAACALDEESSLGFIGDESIIGGVVDLMLEDLQTRLLAFAKDAADAATVLERQTWHKPDGQEETELLCMALTAHGEAVWMVLSPAFVSSYVEAKRQPVQSASPKPVKHALEGQKVSGTVGLGSVELTVGMLASLAKGDVIRLPSRVDEPVGLRFEHSGMICKAYLGKQNGCYAVQLDGVVEKNAVDEIETAS